MAFSFLFSFQRARPRLKCISPDVGSAKFAWLNCKRASKFLPAVKCSIPISFRILAEGSAPTRNVNGSSLTLVQLAVKRKANRKNFRIRFVLKIKDISKFIGKALKCVKGSKTECLKCYENYMKLTMLAIF